MPRVGHVHREHQPVGGVGKGLGQVHFEGAEDLGEDQQRHFAVRALLGTAAHLLVVKKAHHVQSVPSAAGYKAVDQRGAGIQVVQAGG